MANSDGEKKDKPAEKPPVEAVRVSSTPPPPAEKEGEPVKSGLHTVYKAHPAFTAKQKAIADKKALALKNREDAKAFLKKVEKKSDEKKPDEKKSDEKKG